MVKKNKKSIIQVIQDKKSRTPMYEGCPTFFVLQLETALFLSNVNVRLRFIK